MKCLVILCLVYFKTALAQNSLEYVCESYFDYSSNRVLNPRCHRNPDVLANFEQLARRNGYYVETYAVETQDGFILTLFRIPYGRRGIQYSNRMPVFLQHGFSSSSTMYAMMGNISLAFLLADEGYDVWLGNFRGSHYSLGHRYLVPTDMNFWNYTNYEHGMYDLPAFFDFVNAKTRQKIIYIGYSISTTAFLIYNIHHPEAIHRFKFSVLLAPLIYLQYMKAPLGPIAKLLPLSAAKSIIYPFTHGTFLMRTPVMLTVAIQTFFGSPLGAMLVYIMKALSCGLGFVQADAAILPLFIGQGLEALPVKSIFYNTQMIINEVFQNYDYGADGNIIHYGSRGPPQFNISNLNVPQHLIYSPGDFLATEKSSLELYREMPASVKAFSRPYRIPNDQFCHTDFYATPSVKGLVYDHLLDFLRKHKDIQ